MCLTRVGKVLAVKGNRALVEFLDQEVRRDIDISMVKVRKNSYVEVFADSALSRLTGKEAQLRKELWLEVRRNVGRSNM